MVEVVVLQASPTPSNRDGASGTANQGYAGGDGNNGPVSTTGAGGGGGGAGAAGSDFSPPNSWAMVVLD